MYLPRNVRLSLPPTLSNGGDLSRVDGTLARYHKGGNAIAELARPSPPARSTPSHPKRTMGGSSEGLMAPSSVSSRTATPSPSLASPSSPARSPPSPPIIMGEGASLAQHRTATVLQCWKWRIWLHRWFDQQATLKQKRLRLQALCRGASSYASSVRGTCHLSPPLTEKSSDRKVLNHPFRTRGQPIPPRKMRRRHKRPRRHPGRRHRPRAPDSGGGPLCMPLIFWATQTLAASDLLGVGDYGSTFPPYVSPTTAATTIQKAYRYSTIRRDTRKRRWQIQLFLAQIELEHNMTCAMQDLQDSDDLMFVWKRVDTG